ncbi:porin family protein [Flavobacterium sp. I3-2]|uniref:porin family protein n=1 Tax=Flavobacterium sp. I3-2 TaxID=2748319 RepID=UPI0015A8228A|nr:porin family protein [Flavobacterium sp. I3-2]
MKIYLLVFLLFSAFGFSQIQDSIPAIERTVAVDDPKYREDQFYFGITHSILANSPSGFKPNSFSTGISFGFLRDFPVNKRRNIAIAPGVGIVFYNLRNNLNVSQDKQQFFINSDYKRNVQNLTYLEIPIEFRWRTSTMYSHKFWRIYTGVKYSYLLHDNAKYEGPFGKYNVKSNPAYNKSIIGAYVTAGFNTWNVYAYYGFNPIFKKDKFPDNKSLNFFNVGLMFYML